MSRTIKVTDSDGEANYVVVEPGPDSGGASYFLPGGEKLVLESATRFWDADGQESYYVTDDEDIEWLLAQ